MIGVTYGPMRRTDAPHLAELTTRAASHDGVPVGITEAGFLEMWGEAYLDMAEDSLAAFVDDNPVAWCRVWHHPSEERQERAHIFGVVDPGFRRRGIGTHLLTWADRRAEERLSARPNDLPKYIRADAGGREDDKRALLERLGMEIVRYFDNMTRSFTHPIPATDTDGFTIEPWDEARSEEVRRVCIAAFRDHWGSAGVTREGWEEWLSSEATRLDLSLIALVDGEVVAYAVNAHHKADNEIHGRHEAWVDSLGTLREHRGRGVATALLTESMRRMSSAGFDSIGLDVDSANPTGAHGLYTRLGFEVFFQSTMYQREIR
jgi:mycothiol synthase